MFSHDFTLISFPDLFCLNRENEMSQIDDEQFRHVHEQSLSI